MSAEQEQRITEVEFPVHDDREAHRLQLALRGRPSGRRGMRVVLSGRSRTFWFRASRYAPERGAVVVDVVEEAEAER